MIYPSNTMHTLIMIGKLLLLLVLYCLGLALSTRNSRKILRGRDTRGADFRQEKKAQGRLRRDRKKLYQQSKQTNV